MSQKETPQEREEDTQRDREREREIYVCGYLWQVSFISISKSSPNPQIYLSTLDNFIVDAQGAAENDFEAVLPQFRGLK